MITSRPLNRDDPASGREWRSLTLGERICSLRLRCKWSQSELGRRACINQSNIARLEADEQQPSLDLLRRLAAALGVFCGALLD